MRNECVITLQVYLERPDKEVIPAVEDVPKSALDVSRARFSEAKTLPIEFPSRSQEEQRETRSGQRGA
jgi:hypothetical protein